MCSIAAHDQKQPAYKDEEISIGDRIIPKHITSEALEVLGATLNFIYIWLKLFDQNYDARRVAYSTAIKYTIKKHPQ